MTPPAHPAGQGAETTRAKLIRQIARLEQVALHGRSDQAAMALRLAKGMRSRLQDLNVAPGIWRQIAGEIGPNGGPYGEDAVDDVCSASSATLDGLPITAREAGEHMRNVRRAA